jgi:type IV secretory pathway protease TraF
MATAQIAVAVVRSPIIRTAIAAAMLDRTGYLTREAPLINRILALLGQTVCRTGATITVDGIEMGVAPSSAPSCSLPVGSDAMDGLVMPRTRGGQR